MIDALNGEIQKGFNLNGENIGNNTWVLTGFHMGLFINTIKSDYNGIVMGTSWNI